MLEERKMVGMAMDTLSLDNQYHKDHDVHYR